MNILIADDTPDNADMLKRWLTRRGHVVAVAVNGEEAVRSAIADPPDLIFMDLSMPVMSGVEATKAIRASDSPAAAAPIVALTAHAMERDRLTCLEAGCNDVATKPVDFQNIQKIIERFAEPVGASK